MVSRRVQFLFVLSSAVILGCGDPTADASKERLAAMAGGSLSEVTPVSGKVLIDGKPTAGVNLYLFKDGKDTTKQARTKADGTYCWSTYEACDGLEAGEYVVTFKHILNEKDNDRYDPADDLLGGKFSDPKKSQYKLSVAKGTPQTTMDYDLKTK